MKRTVSVFLCAILIVSAAFAAPPEEGKSDAPIVGAVQREFLAPLARRNTKQKEFSRAAMPATASRLRVLGMPQRDVAGAEYVRFAIDTRRVAPEWNEAEYTGCVYTASSAVYLKRGEQYRPASTWFTRGPVSSDGVSCGAGQ